jgi:catechol 2,3-dioxygenase-like lactoylglutathione lyase family enzyme
MRLTFLYHPVSDLKQAVAFYRDLLGWDEAWRMGDDTAAMQIPGSEVLLMLDATTDVEAGPSGFFEVDDVDAFWQALPDSVTKITPPQDLDPIRYAAVKDPGGNLVRLFTDLSPADEDSA